MRMTDPWGFIGTGFVSNLIERKVFTPISKAEYMKNRPREDEIVLGIGLFYDHPNAVGAFFRKGNFVYFEGYLGLSELGTGIEAISSDKVF
ncbi:hypothetical protein LCGC14_2986830, partial [marine sediment metagenome]